MALSDRLFWRPLAAGLRPLASGLRRVGFIPSNPWAAAARATQGHLKAGSLSDRLTKSWVSTPVPIDEVIRQGLQSTRARAREQALNNDYDSRFDAMVRSNVVGPYGIRPQVKVKTADGELDRLLNSAVERAWQEWSRPENCDVTGKDSLVGLQGLWISTVRKDGESIVRYYEGRTAGRFGFQIQLQDPELLDVKFSHDTPRIRFGVELDERDKPLAYHFLDQKVTDTPYISGYGYSAATGRDHIRVPAELIRHGFIRKHVGQKRGLPWSATALPRMKMLEGYEEAAVVNARVGASKMGFFKSEDGRGLPAQTTSSGAKRIAAEPGTFDDLPANTSLETWNPTYPHEQYPYFVKSQLRGIASGLNVSYTVLANDLEGVNFSSIRTAILEDRDIWRGLQCFTIDQFLRPTFERWLLLALVTGQVVDESGGVVSVAEYDRIKMATTFQTRGWPWVDPFKDAKAATESITNGTGTISEYIREKGRDPNEVFEEQEDEQNARREKGLVVEEEESSEDDVTTINGIPDRVVDEIVERVLDDIREGQT